MCTGVPVQVVHCRMYWCTNPTSAGHRKNHSRAKKSVRVGQSETARRDLSIDAIKKVGGRRVIIGPRKMSIHTSAIRIFTPKTPQWEGYVRLLRAAGARKKSGSTHERYVASHYTYLATSGDSTDYTDQTPTEYNRGFWPLQRNPRTTQDACQRTRQSECICTRALERSNVQCIYRGPPLPIYRGPTAVAMVGG